MSHSFTKGKEIPLIISFCIPVMIGLLLQQLYGILDTIIVGKYLGVKALAGVGATASFSFLLTGFAAGLTTGFTLPISKALGANDIPKLKKYIYNAIYLCIIITLILTGVSVYYCKEVLELMQTPINILENAYNYVSIILAGLGFTIIYNMGSGIFRAMGDSKTPLFYLVISAVLNILLDLAFIAVFHMGVEGAALATIIAQGVSGIACIVSLFSRHPYLLPGSTDMKMEADYCGHLLKMGLPMALQFSINAIGNIILQTAINNLGSNAVAAVSSAQKIQMLVIGPLEGFGITMATYCSQNHGGDKYRRIKEGMFKDNILTFVYCIFSMLIIFLFGDRITLMFIDPSETQVISMVHQYLFVNAFFYFGLGLIFNYRNAVQSIGYTKIPMFGGFLELAVRSVLTFGLVKYMGYTIICWAAPLAWVAADMFLILQYNDKFRKICKEAYKRHKREERKKAQTKEMKKADGVRKIEISRMSSVN